MMSDVYDIEKGIRIECPYSWVRQTKCTLTTLSGKPIKKADIFF